MVLAVLSEEDLVPEPILNWGTILVDSVRDEAVVVEGSSDEVGGVVTTGCSVSDCEGVTVTTDG